MVAGQKQATQKASEARKQPEAEADQSSWNWNWTVPTAEGERFKAREAGALGFHGRGSTGVEKETQVMTILQIYLWQNRDESVR